MRHAYRDAGLGVECIGALSVGVRRLSERRGVGDGGKVGLNDGGAVSVIVGESVGVRVWEGVKVKVEVAVRV